MCVSSTQGIPSVQVVEKTYNGSLKEALTEEKYIYLSFVASFVIVGESTQVHIVFGDSECTVVFPDTI